VGSSRPKDDSAIRRTRTRDWELGFGFAGSPLPVSGYGARFVSPYRHFMAPASRYGPAPLPGSYSPHFVSHCRFFATLRADLPPPTSPRAEGSRPDALTLVSSHVVSCWRRLLAANQLHKTLGEQRLKVTKTGAADSDSESK